MPRDVYLRLLRDCLPLQCVEKVASVGRSVGWLRESLVLRRLQTLSFILRTFGECKCAACERVCAHVRAHDDKFHCIVVSN